MLVNFFRIRSYSFFGRQPVFLSSFCLMDVPKIHIRFLILNGIKLGTSPIGSAGIAPPSEISHFEVIRPPDYQYLFGNEATHGEIIIETIDRTGEEQLMSPPVRGLVVGPLHTLHSGSIKCVKMI